MADTNTNTESTPKRKRIKLAVFPVPDAATIERLVSEGTLRRVDIPAREATAKRKPQPAKTQYLSDSRKGVLALYGGNEKAANLAAALYWDSYVKRMNSKGRTADPLRAVNRISETFAKMDDSILATLPPEAREAIRTLQNTAKANPVAPKTRKPKAKS